MSFTPIVDTLTTESVVTVSLDVAGSSPASTDAEANETASQGPDDDGLSDFEILDGSQGEFLTYYPKLSNNFIETSVASDGHSDSDSDTDDGYLVAIVGQLYDFIPVRMEMDNSIISETFYAVYVGRRVGITTESYVFFGYQLLILIPFLFTAASPQRS